MLPPLRQADSIERTAQVCPPSHFEEERHLARAEPSARGRQTPGQTRPVKAVSRRSRAREPRALTGLGWSGSGITSADRSLKRQVRSTSATHCTDLLSAKEDLVSCNVRRCQKNCDKLLHCQTIDREAPWSLYPAIKRSMSRASPVLRNSSPNCDEAKNGKSIPRADSLLLWCRRYADDTRPRSDRGDHPEPPPLRWSPAI